MQQARAERIHARDDAWENAIVSPFGFDLVQQRPDFPEFFARRTG